MKDGGAQSNRVFSTRHCAHLALYPGEGHNAVAISGGHYNGVRGI